MYILLSISAVALLLIANEIWWRHKKTHREHHRKIIHIMVGSFIAFWPLYISWNYIRLISLAFLLVVIISKALNLFAAIHEVERFSVGEICFALAVGLLTFVTQSHWVYAVALLQMSIADGLAAIIGIHFGKTNSYKVLGATKSIAGSTAFFLSSFTILIIANALVEVHIAIWALFLVAVSATIVENIAVYGLDDLLLPLVTALFLSRL